MSGLGYRRRGHEPLEGAACATSPRWVRGGIGFLIGGMIGGMIGGGVALALVTSNASAVAVPGAPSTTASVQSAQKTALIATGVTIAGAIGGLTVGAIKPEC